MNNVNEKLLAMLIDCDNASASAMPRVLEEANKFGKVGIRRAYGDWSEANLSHWSAVFVKMAIQPIQQFRDKNKNSTDIALVVDAMDLLHGEKIEGFCLYSGDSDYTRLVMRMREAGMLVVGFGRRGNTSARLIPAFDRYIYTENLLDRPQGDAGHSKTPSELKKLKGEFIEIFNTLSPDNASVSLSLFGKEVHKRNPAFDSRTYNQKSLSELIKVLKDTFNLQKNETGNPLLNMLKR